MPMTRYTKDHLTQSLFYQLPKFLFVEPLKSTLSNDAKILYSLLRDRHSLSLANGWFNSRGEVYLICTRSEMCDLLGCSLPTVRKIVKELTKANLIEEEAVEGYCSRIYLAFLSDIPTYTPSAKPENIPPMLPADMEPEAADPAVELAETAPEKDLQTPRKNFSLPPKEFFFPPRKDFSPNNNNINKTNSSNTQSINLSPAKPEKEKIDGLNYYEEKIQTIDEELEFCRSEIADNGRNNELVKRIEKLRSDRELLLRLQVDYTQLTLLEIEDALREQIEYEIITGSGGSCEHDKGLVDNIVSIMAEALASPSTSHSTKQRFLSITEEHIEYICFSVGRYDKKINNMKRFLERVIYNAPLTENAWITNLVQSNGTF